MDARVFKENSCRQFWLYRLMDDPSPLTIIITFLRNEQATADGASVQKRKVEKTLHSRFLGSF
jgi:hypothetical protein